MLGSDKADERTTRLMEEFSIMVWQPLQESLDSAEERWGGGGKVSEDETEEAIMLKDSTEVARGQVLRHPGTMWAGRLHKRQAVTK